MGANSNRNRRLWPLLAPVHSQGAISCPGQGWAACGPAADPALSRETSTALWGLSPSLADWGRGEVTRGCPRFRGPQAQATRLPNRGLPRQQHAAPPAPGSSGAALSPPTPRSSHYGTFWNAIRGSVFQFLTFALFPRLHLGQAPATHSPAQACLSCGAAASPSRQVPSPVTAHSPAQRVAPSLEKGLSPASRSSKGRLGP